MGIIELAKVASSAMDGVDIMTSGNQSPEGIKIALPLDCVITGGKYLNLILKICLLAADEMIRFNPGSLLPGRKLHWLERSDKGVPVTLALQKQILQLKRELNLLQYKFPF